MTAWRLLPWQKDAIVEAYREGEKRESISEEFGVSEAYPAILARRRGVAPRSITGRPPKRLHLLKPVLTVQA